MKRRVKEFIEIEDHHSLDDLIAKLIEVRDALPADSEAELRLRGDDVFGRKLSISYFRAQTADEAELRDALRRRLQGSARERARPSPAGIGRGLLPAAQGQIAHRRLTARGNPGTRSARVRLVPSGSEGVFAVVDRRLEIP